MKLPDNEAQTVNDLVTEKTAKIGEKISVRRFVRYEAGNGLVDSYIHMGGKVGVLVLAEGEKTDSVKEVLHDVALQIAAASPVAPEYVTRDQVNPEHLHHETEILAAQARNEGKPEKIIEKMVQGRINKFYEEVCLMEQSFVKDSEMTVEKMINTKAPGTEDRRFHPLQDGRRPGEEGYGSGRRSCGTDQDEGLSQNVFKGMFELNVPFFD